MSADSDSDGAPEELTFEQGNKQEEEIQVTQRENKARVAQEKKDKRRLWAQRRTQRETATKVTSRSKNGAHISDPETNEEPNATISGMLPSDIVSFLATRERQVFTSDSEKETVEDETTTVRKKKKQKLVRTNAVLLKDLPPPVCAEKSLNFLKRRKAQIARSQAVLKSANQTLRLLSAPGNLLSKSSPGVVNKG